MNGRSSRWYNDEDNYEINHFNDLIEHVDESTVSSMWKTQVSVAPFDEDQHMSIINSYDHSINNNEKGGEYGQRGNVYSGPTVVDIEKALSLNTRSSSDFRQPQPSHARIIEMEKVLNKTDNKYTLKIKSSSTGMVDDGYKWRKYGQKFIKNSPNPRSYYKCTNIRCGAKKQVERSMEDPDTLIITYEGLHLHFSYPFFNNSHYQQLNPPFKKARKILHECNIKYIKKEVNPNDELGETNNPNIFPKVDNQQATIGHQGLLEDVVPLQVRNPSKGSMLHVPICCSSFSPPLNPSSTFVALGL